MKKEKLLIFLVIALVAMNLGLMIFLHTNQPSPPPTRQEPFQIIIEKLRLDNDQQSQFEQMRHSHHQRIMELDKNFSTVLSSYFELLTDSITKLALRDSLEAAMATIEKGKARITFDHFEQLKNILREDQKKSFEELAPQLIRVINQRNPPPPRRN